MGDRTESALDFAVTVNVSTRWAEAPVGTPTISTEALSTIVIRKRIIDRVPFRSATRWRECMGIEPTQPDVVRSRTVLKTVRATRLHPLPASSRNHETVAPARKNLADLDGF